jgi:membrane fusion protein, multidrug efflux system
MARLNLEFTEVRSPIAGRAGRAMVTEGNLVEPGATVLTTVVSLHPVYVYFEGDEQVFLRSADLARDGARNAVFVGLSNEEGFPHEGVLDFVDNQVDPRTGTIRSRAVLDNHDRAFTPGLFARVRLQGSASDTALLVDEKAVLTDQDRKYVYVLGPDNKALRRDITLGRTVDGLRIVSAGLQPGDQVIVHGVQKVFFPGMAVAPQMIAMGDPPPAPPAPQKTAAAGHKASS